MTGSAEEDPIRLSSRLRHRAVGEEGVLLNLDNDRIIVVNDVGLYIVQSLQQPMSRQALIGAIVSEFEVDASAAATDLDDYLQQLDAEQLLEAPTSPGGS